MLLASIENGRILAWHRRYELACLLIEKLL